MSCGNPHRFGDVLFSCGSERWRRAVVTNEQRSDVTFCWPYRCRRNWSPESVLD